MTFLTPFAYLFGTKPRGVRLVPKILIKVATRGNRCGFVQDKGNQMNDQRQDMRNENLIKENLKRAFDDKATEELPSELLALLAQLRGQEEQNDQK